MALIQTAFLSTTLASTLATGTGISIVLADYTKIDSAMANSDTMEMVIDRTDATEREVVLVTKVSNGNYTVDSRGLHQTTEQSHDTNDEVTNDDTPGYFNGLKDASAFPTGTSSVGIPLSKIKLETKAPFS